jgi:hypothetical protein
MSAAHSLQMSRASMRAKTQNANERTAVYFAASIAGLCVILAAAHFIGGLLMNSNPNGSGMWARNLIKKARYFHVFHV